MQKVSLTNLISASFQEISYQLKDKNFKELRHQLISHAKSCADGFELWDRIDEQIGMLYQNKLQPTVIDLKNKFIEKLITYEKDRLETSFRESSEKGCQQWFILISKSITKFRNRFHSKFCQFEFQFPEDKIEKVNNIKNSIQYITQNHWGDIYDSIEYLSDLSFIPVELKSELYVILGEIQQYHFYKPYKANYFFSRAEKLSSDSHRVLCSRGNYLFEQNKIDESQKYYLKLVKNFPNRTSGYVGMGNIAEKKNENAEKWYKKAIKLSAGDTDGYIELAKYYIGKRPEEIHELISTLKEQISFISASSVYDFHIDIGYEFLKNKNFKEALSHFGNAEKFNKYKVSAYTQKGFLFLDPNYDQNFEKARSYFKKVIELLPDSVVGHLNIAHTYELEGRWPLVLEWCEKCPDRILDYQDKKLAIRALAYRKQNDYKASEQELRKAFATDKKSLWASVNMENLAENYYVHKGDKETAISLYKEVLNNIGDSYKADYHNRIANLWYYFSDYDQALEQYQLAVNYKPKNAVFHRNLSGAYKGLKKYDEAISEIETAHELDPEELVYKQSLASLHNAKGHDLFSSGKYVEAIEEYTESTKLVPNDDIYYNNIAIAYENIKEAASPLEVLDKAIYYYRRARDINPKDEYLNNIEYLTAKKEFVPQYGEKSLEWTPVVTPIALEVAFDLIPLVESGENSLSPNFQKSINNMKDSLYHVLGHVRIPGIRVKGNETDLPDGTYIIFINDIPLVSGYVSIDKLLCNATVDRLNQLDIKGEEAINPADGSECAWISAEFKILSAEVGLTTWDAADYMILHLSSVLRKNFAEFVSIQTVTNQIQMEANQYYQMINGAPGGIARFTDVLKIFAEEEVPIIEFETICKSYTELTQSNVPKYEIVEELRFLEEIRPLLPGNKNGHESCLVYKLGDKIIRFINDGIITKGDAALLALEPDPTQQILTAVRNEVLNLPSNAQNLVIMIKDWRIRRHVRKLIELEFPNLAVMSEREIMKRTETIATITLD